MLCCTVCMWLCISIVSLCLRCQQTVDMSFTVLSSCAAPVWRMLWAPQLPLTGSSCSPLPLVNLHRRPHPLVVWTNPFGQATLRLTHHQQAPWYSHRLGQPIGRERMPPPPQSQYRGRKRLKAAGRRQPHCSVTTFYNSTNSRKKNAQFYIYPYPSCWNLNTMYV